MQRLKILGSALMAVCVLGIGTSTSASAEEVLPKLSVETGGTGKFGATKWNLTGADFKSPKGLISKFTATKGTAGRLGTFDILLEASEFTGEPCLSLGDALGIVLLTGEWHLVHLPKEPKHISLLLLINAVHIECPGIGLLILILQGSTTLLLILPVETKTKAFKLLLNVKEGKQENNEWVDDAGVVHKTEELAGLNGGKDKAASQETQGIELNTEKETVIEEK